MDKSIGVSHYLANKEHKGNKNRISRSVPWKNNRTRGVRRKADRHSHHRRRKIMKEDISKNAGENIPKSMTTLQHHHSHSFRCNSRYYISNYKMSKAKWE
jgi:hypothetical protein